MNGEKDPGAIFLPEALAESFVKMRDNANNRLRGLKTRVTQLDSEVLKGRSGARLELGEAFLEIYAYNEFLKDLGSAISNLRRRLGSN